MATHPPRPSNYILKIVEVLIFMEINHYPKEVFHSYSSFNYGPVIFKGKQQTIGILLTNVILVGGRCQREF